MLVEEVFSHSALGVGRGDAGQAAYIITQLLDGLVAVREEMLF